MSNRLAEETSPYLRQHADNPVDWYPWGEPALAKARDEDKPILLSVGYSACHWCHVMAHESFEDEAVAALMNEHYVNIKVDREERPDLDKIYQLTHQIMAQRPGGWPLTVILDPHTLAPFMTGTYFPKQSGYGMPAFPDVLRQVADWYAHNKHQLQDQKHRLDEVLARLEPQPADSIGDDAPLRAAREQLEANFDAEYGGFTGAPKFPHPSSLELLFTLAANGDVRAGEMARFSLRRMGAGGLFDHLGGGFYRYAVDARWEIPHFEKMLYDNGPLLALTAAQAAATGESLFERAAQATADWALREMQSPEGGFYASLDADSEGGEGACYLWDREEIQAVLGDDYDPFAARYGLDGAPNFEGRWHLRLTDDSEPEAATADVLQRARQRLFEQRAQRPGPGRDEKQLTAWNALMVRGLAAAHRHLGREDCLDAARRALDFLHGRLWREHRLLAVYKDGEAKLSAYLDDYAFLLDALLEMLQERWDSKNLAWAQALADALLRHFEDRSAGGFFFTPHDHESLIHRPKPLADESTPAGNGIAARALLRLGWLVGEPRYLEAAEATLKYAAGALAHYPIAHTTLVMALQDCLHPPEVVILRGGEQALAAWRRAAAAPDRLVFAIADDAELPPALAEKRPQGEAVAYLCRGTTCSPPIHDLRQLIRTQ